MKLLLDGIDRSLLAVSAESLELQDAVAGGKEGVVAALAYVDAGMDLGSSLTDKHVAREPSSSICSTRRAPTT